MLLFIARNSGTYNKFNTPRKHSKAGQQIGTKIAAEPICCPILKEADKCFGVYIPT
jgi:hypothetical protein